MLDELEDEVATHPDELDLDDKTDEALDLPETYPTKSWKLMPTPRWIVSGDEELLSVEDVESWSDDPVRMY